MRDLMRCVLFWARIRRRERGLLALAALIKQIGIGFIVIVS
jgi:hypothetical protein